VGLDLETGEPNKVVTMDLYADNVGKPGTILATATNTVTTTMQKLTFDFNQTLSANTTYWAAIGGVDKLRWAVSDSFGHPEEQNSSGYSWQGGSYSEDGGTNWTDYEPSWTENSGSISVVAVAVPEPSAALLGALGSLFLLRRRR
jgi:hypothetical protein